MPTEAFAFLRPPRAVLFDMDGVLVNTFDAWVAVMDECRRRRGLPVLGPEPIRATWGQGIQADCQSFFKGEDARSLAAEYDRGFVEHIHNVKAEPGAQATVRALQQHRLRTALVTNSPRALSLRILQQIGLADAFDILACGDETPHGKPAPDLVHLALARLNLQAKDTVMVGDTALDFAAARGAGVPVIGYRLSGGDATLTQLPELVALLGLPAIA